MSGSDPNADAFMRRILANPIDALPRLVFADWLEETGVSSNVAWARYIRLADELANAPTDDARRPKMASDLERFGNLIRANLRLRAEVFVAYPESILQLLPSRNLMLNLRDLVPSRESLDLVEDVWESVVNGNKLFPLRFSDDGERFYLTASGKLDDEIQPALEFSFDRKVEIIPADRESFDSLLERYVDPAYRAMLSTIGGHHLIDDDWISTMLTEAVATLATMLELIPERRRVEIIHHRGGERLGFESLPVRVMPNIIAGLRRMANLPVRFREGLQTGVIPFPFNGAIRELPIVIQSTPLGPHVQITIPPIDSTPPQALKHAA